MSPRNATTRRPRRRVRRRRLRVLIGPSFAFALLLGVVATGCGATAGGSTPTPAGLTTVGLVVGGHQRSYDLYVPPGNSKNHRLPLVLVYHGAGDTAANEATETDLWRLDRREHNLILAFAQGYDKTWNEGAGHTPAERAGINDVAFTMAMLRRIESQHAVDLQRVVATGISNGALLTELLGCKLASNLTLIAPVEGELPVSVSGGCHPAQPISVYEVHGTADPIIPYGGGHFNGVGGGTTVLSAPNSAARWAGLDGCSKTPRQTASKRTRQTSYTGCRDGVTVTLASIQGGQHQWPPSFGQTLLAAIASLPSGRRAVTP